jgi:ubiquinone/menaquinone biosynthesis C-methylase UbiE
MVVHVWWYTSVIPVLGRLKQEDCKFKASLGYTVRVCLKQNKMKQINNSGLEET